MSFNDPPPPPGQGSGAPPSDNNDNAPPGHAGAPLSQELDDLRTEMRRGFGQLRTQQDNRAVATPPRPPGIKNITITPTAFEGDEVELFDDWLPMFEEYFEQHNGHTYNEMSQVTMLHGLLAKPVRKQLKILPMSERDTLQKNFNYLRQRYGGEDLYLKAQREFKKRDRKEGERIGDYADILRSLYSRGYPETPSSAVESPLYQRIWEGQNPTIQHKSTTLYANPENRKRRTSQDIVGMIQNLENSLTMTIETPRDNRYAKRSDAPAEKTSSPDDSPAVAAAPYVPKRIDPLMATCFNCNQVGHFAKECTSPKNIRRVNINKAAALCSFCEVPDHYEFNCPALHKLKKDESSNC